MSDPLYELLVPNLETKSRILPFDSTVSSYLTRLTTLSLGSLTTNEPDSLKQSSQSALRSLQALSKRSHKSVISATDHLSHLASILPSLASQTTSLEDTLPILETSASDFAKKYDKSTENAVLDRRKRAMLLNRNVDRVGNILDLPTLLSTAVGGSSVGGTGSTTAGIASSGYASALDIHAHVKRLKALYPESALVKDILNQSDNEIQNLITVLITGLQSPGLKLAGAMRTIGWLRRVAPDLARRDADFQNRGIQLVSHGNEEGSLGALFLICRLATLRRTMEALEPLKELADQETVRRIYKSTGKSNSTNQQDSWTDGAQTERYLKRYIEIFREQSFAIVSMYKSIFPLALQTPVSTAKELEGRPRGHASKAPAQDMLGEMPSALATFAPHLVDMLFDALREYMPNVVERASRDSLLTQVLYCAGSLGRLGADFGMMLAVLEQELAGHVPSDGPNTMIEEHEQEQEWVQIMKKHRVQASRLELLASGVGTGRKGSSQLEIRSPQ